MNLLGYYKPDEVWIPDPVREQSSYSNANNKFKLKEKVKEDEENSKESTQILNRIGKEILSITDRTGVSLLNLEEEDECIWNNNGGTGDVLSFT